MGYVYKCSPAVDVFIYSGLTPNLEERFDHEYGIKKNSPNYEKELNKYKASFKEHKSELDQKLELVSFANLINRNFSTILEMSKRDDLKDVVVTKLENLANDRLKKEEDFNPLHRFFHIIGQIFKGHGIRTEGQWAQKLVQKMKLGGASGQIVSVKGKVPKEIKESIQKCFQSATGISVLQVSMPNMSLINALSKEQFKEVLSLYLLGSIPEGMHNPYNRIFLNLNDEKKQWLMEGILSDSNWPTQAVKLGIIEFNGHNRPWENLKPNSEMIRMVQTKPKAMFDAFKKERSPFYSEAAKALLEYAVKDMIHRNDVAGMSNFMKQTDGKSGCIAILLKQPHNFEPRQIAWLKENFDV